MPNTSSFQGGLVRTHPAPEGVGPRLALEPLVAATHNFACLVIIADLPGFHGTLVLRGGVLRLRAPITEATGHGGTGAVGAAAMEAVLLVAGRHCDVYRVMAISLVRDG